MKKYMVCFLALMMMLGMPLEADCEQVYDDDRPVHPLAREDRLPELPVIQELPVPFTPIITEQNVPVQEEVPVKAEAAEPSVEVPAEKMEAEISSSANIDNRIQNGAYIKVKAAGNSTEGEDNAIEDAKKKAVARVIEQLLKKGTYLENTTEALLADYEKYVINCNIISTDLTENNITVDTWVNVSLDKLKTDIKAYEKIKEVIPAKPEITLPKPELPKIELPNPELPTPVVSDEIVISQPQNNAGDKIVERM